jgi:hypothetical protein
MNNNSLIEYRSQPLTSENTELACFGFGVSVWHHAKPTSLGDNPDIFIRLGVAL